MASSISILNLPPGSSVTLDGQTIVLQRDDFVGIYGIPIDSDFHLVVARAAACEHGNVAALSVGFAFETNGGDALALVRRYDATTEEVSSSSVDDTTASNLQSRIQNGQLEPERFIPFTQIVSTERLGHWKQLTNYVSQRLLRNRGIDNGSKIVPGCYGADDMEADAQHSVVDGSSINYPAIPVSIRHSRHPGTRRFLASLTPSERTALFLQDKPQNMLLESILRTAFGNRWSDLLGDIQLSYTLFLHLQCLSSLEHWRDLVAMLSSVDCDCVELHLGLYCDLLQVLAKQVTSIEEDFFEDIETSGDNFLVPALRTLCQTTSKVSDEDLLNSRNQLCRILENRFRDTFVSIDDPMEELTKTNRTEMEVQGDKNDQDSDCEDRPVVISTEEVEASLARSSQPSRMKPPTAAQEDYPLPLRKKYPVLFAAKMEHEDILMTCARALDDATDVSLVREAGTFLVDEVEADTSAL